MQLTTEKFGIGELLMALGMGGTATISSMSYTEKLSQDAGNMELVITTCIAFFGVLIMGFKAWDQHRHHKEIERIERGRVLPAKKRSKKP